MCVCVCVEAITPTAIKLPQSSPVWKFMVVGGAVHTGCGGEIWQEGVLLENGLMCWWEEGGRCERRCGDVGVHVQADAHLGVHVQADAHLSRHDQHVQTEVCSQSV